MSSFSDKKSNAHHLVARYDIYHHGIERLGNAIATDVECLSNHTTQQVTSGGP